MPAEALDHASARLLGEQCMSAPWPQVRTPISRRPVVAEDFAALVIERRAPLHPTTVGSAIEQPAVPISRREYNKETVYGSQKHSGTYDVECERDGLCAVSASV